MTLEQAKQILKTIPTTTHEIEQFKKALRLVSMMRMPDVG